MEIESEHGFPAKLIRKIGVKLDGLKSSVRITDKVSTSFMIFDRLMQDGAYSNLLFNIVLDVAIGDMTCKGMALLSHDRK